MSRAAGSSLDTDEQKSEGSEASAGPEGSKDVFSHSHDTELYLQSSSINSGMLSPSFGLGCTRPA